MNSLLRKNFMVFAAALSLLTPIFACASEPSTQVKTSIIRDPKSAAAVAQIEKKYGNHIDACNELIPVARRLEVLALWSDAEIVFAKVDKRQRQYREHDIESGFEGAYGVVNALKHLGRDAEALKISKWLAGEVHQKYLPRGRQNFDSMPLYLKPGGGASDLKVMVLNKQALNAEPARRKQIAAEILSIAKKESNIRYEMESYWILGETYRQAGDLKLAEQQYWKAVELCEQKKDALSKLTALEQLHDYYDHSKNPKDEAAMSERMLPMRAFYFGDWSNEAVKSIYCIFDYYRDTHQKAEALQWGQKLLTVLQNKIDSREKVSKLEAELRNIKLGKWRGPRKPVSNRKPDNRQKQLESSKT